MFGTILRASRARLTKAKSARSTGISSKRAHRSHYYYKNYFRHCIHEIFCRGNASTAKFCEKNYPIHSKEVDTLPLCSKILQRRLRAAVEFE
jgi:hypothetical protein